MESGWVVVTPSDDGESARRIATDDIAPDTATVGTDAVTTPDGGGSASS
jgi:hypothetical protein